MTWVEWQKWRESRRAALHKYGCEAPSRRTVSFDTAERHRLEVFGGRRIPAWAEPGAEGGTSSCRKVDAR